MNAVRAVLFDLDDTLLDGSGHRDAIRRACAEIGALIGVDPERVFEANSEVWQTYWREIGDKWTLGALTGEAVTREAWRRTLAACGRDDPSLTDLAAETHIRLVRAGLRLHADVPAVLDALEPHYRLGLITNGASDTQRTALRGTDIERRFGAIVVSGEVGVAQPDASVFRTALEGLGVEPEEAWHVGDNLHADIAGARAAGVTGVWINRRNEVRRDEDPVPHHEVGSLSELPALLENASSRWAS